MTTTTSIETAVFANQLELDETIDLLLQHSKGALAQGYAYTLFSYRDVRAKYRELVHLELEPRLPTDTAIDLVDHAFLTDHIGMLAYREMLVSAGMTHENANNHAETMRANKTNEAERTNYLADPSNAPAYCTRCGKETPENDLSRRRICTTCGFTASATSLLQIRQRTGPYYRKWRSGMMHFLYSLEDDSIGERREYEREHGGDFGTAVDKVTPEQVSATLDRIGDMIDHDKRPKCFGDYCADDTCQWYHECGEPDADDERDLQDRHPDESTELWPRDQTSGGLPF